MKRLISLFVALIVCLLPGALAPPPAGAHPMGNFSINHYVHIVAGRNALQLRYVLDRAEIPTFTERGRMDTDGNGTISAEEQSVYLSSEIQQLRSGLTLSVSDCSPQWAIADPMLEFKPGAGGLNTMRLTFTLYASLPPLPSAGRRVVYKDANFAERTGWKEIVATSEGGAMLARSTASVADSSRELTAYPADPGVAPPQQTEAEFTVVAGNAALTGMGGSTEHPSAVYASRTPQDGFTQAISQHTLTADVIVISLGLAFVFGAFHALSPGHGKAMVAAYLVGTRGTIRHAMFLGGVITLTHTISVFALGLFTLIASQYVVPERLYPVLSVGSGLLITGMGVMLFWQRSADALADRRERAEREDELLWGDGDAAESPIPEHAPVSLRSLVVLGITGGALPCPSALVVMLGAIALHRVAFGMALICAFSLGLACVLTGVGILVVRAKGMLDRMPAHKHLAPRLPALSAALVTLVGLFLVARALHGQP